ncbi:MAG: P-II family nitrogen regulator [Pseudomonadota bacterium]
MQMITAIIRPHRYEAVREELVKIGVEGITVAQVSGFGRQRGQTEIYRGAEYQTNEVPKLRLDIVVPTDILNQVLETIQKTAATGKTGDGKIFVHPLGEVIRIRTGEKGDTAVG